MAGTRARTHRGRRWRASPLLGLALPVIALLVVSATAGTALAAPLQSTAPLDHCIANPGNCIAVQPGYGATGTQVTANGSNLHSGDTITIGYSTDGCKTVITISGASKGAGSDGTVKITFPWPSTPAGHYDVCATDTASGVTLQAPGGFQVDAPAITATSPVTSGQTVTVNGTGFQPTSSAGAQVEVLYGGADGCATSVATETVGSDGTFTATFPAPNETADTTIIVAAVEPQATCSATPILKATANVVVQVALQPTISVIGQVNSGDTMHVNGTQFRAADGPVQILYGAQGSDGCAHVLGTAPVNADGTFTTTVTAPSVNSQTTITVAGVQPVGSCASGAKQKALVAVTIMKPGGTFFGIVGSGMAVFCLAGLLLLLLLLLLLFLLLRRRNKEQPVTIEERDRVVVNANRQGGGTGTAQVERQIVARDARGNVTPIAEEVYTSQEDLVDDPGSGGASGGSGGGFRGPSGGNPGPYSGLGRQ
jgi:hypothetical protein